MSVGAETVVSLLQTTPIILDVCFITDRVAYASSDLSSVVSQCTLCLGRYLSSVVSQCTLCLGRYLSSVVSQCTLCLGRYLLSVVSQCTLCLGRYLSSAEDLVS